jgi:hypothetical protein
MNVLSIVGVNAYFARCRSGVFGRREDQLDEGRVPGVAGGRRDEVNLAGKRGDEPRCRVLRGRRRRAERRGQNGDDEYEAMENPGSPSRRLATPNRTSPRSGCPRRQVPAFGVIVALPPERVVDGPGPSPGCLFFRRRFDEAPCEGVERCRSAGSGTTNSAR